MKEQIMALIVKLDETPEHDKYGEDTRMFFDKGEALADEIVKLITEQK